MKKTIGKVLSTGILLSAFLLQPGGSVPQQKEQVPCACTVENAFGEKKDVEISSRFWELLFGKKEKKESEEPEHPQEVRKLCPGGDVLGVVIRGCGVTVADAKDENLPLKKGDKILKMDGIDVTECEQIQKELEKSSGEPISFLIQRGEKEMEIEITPLEENGKFHLGLTLSDNAAGIGTLTYINMENGTFGCLGHAISGGESDAPLPMTKGLTTDALLGGIKRGASGAPGELRGVLTDEVTGRILRNTSCGVFGTFTDAEAAAFDAREEVEILPRDAVKEGSAVIRSTLKNGLLGEYKIELYEIDRDSSGTKSFRVRVTDPDLIAITGGIVRGMSGSPILQDGKLVGAVTHVTVGDPTEGYGIFIENMLEASGENADLFLPDAA